MNAQQIISVVVARILREHVPDHIHFGYCVCGWHRQKRGPGFISAHRDHQANVIAKELSNRETYQNVIEFEKTA